MKRRLLTYLFLIGLLTAIFGVVAGFKMLMPPKTYTYYRPYTAEDVFVAVNRQRAAFNLPPLQRDLKLTAAAESKAADMAAKNYFSHNAPDGETPWQFIEAAGYDYQAAGENLAINFNTADGVVAGWMNSPGHRANILNKNFTQMGIALAEEKTGALVVQEFGKPAEDELSGKASYYSYTIGEYDSSDHFVAAARDFPRKSTVLVTNKANGKQVEVLITDFGPDGSVFPDRILDLSPKAFRAISDDGTLKRGVLPEVSARLVEK